MEKSRIFVASSRRTLVLAEKLRDELQTNYCEAVLWSEEGRRQPGVTIIDMLETSAENYDFAVIVLAKDDVMVRDTGDTLRARDNCVFEAGLFIGALGRERCFLVNSVEQEHLPSDLAGVISLPFEEPADLTDRETCAQAVRGVSAALKDAVQRTGASMPDQRVQLLSVDEVFHRERPHSDGGDLREGQVVVCDVQPFARPDLALQIARNLSYGITYVYFLQSTPDTIAKTIQSLQVIAVAGVRGTESTVDFAFRTDAVIREKSRILDALHRMCETQSLVVSFLPIEPQFRFRLHNASDPDLARLYVKLRGRGFMPWAEGNDAVKIWTALPRFFVPSTQRHLFVPLKGSVLEDTEKQLFENSIDEALSRYFPGMEDEVRELCYVRSAKAASRKSGQAR